MTHLFFSALVWGKITTTTTKKATTQYPDTSEDMILTVEPLAEGKHLNRKFSFNLTAQRQLEIRKQLTAETVVNNYAVFSYDDVANKVYIGFYNSEAFAEIEKFGAIPKMEIGKTTMGFSSKEMHEGLQKQLGAFDTTKETYLKLTPIDAEGLPVQMYALSLTSEIQAAHDAAVLEDSEGEGPDFTEIEVASEQAAAIHAYADAMNVPELANEGETADISTY